MNVDAESMIAFGGAVAVWALLEIFKRTAKLKNNLQDRLIPVLALVLGVAWNALLLNYANAADQRPVTVLLYGLLSGFGASGIWAQALAQFVHAEQPESRG